MGLLCIKMVEMTGTAPVSLEVTLDFYYHRFFWVLPRLKRSKTLGRIRPDILPVLCPEVSEVQRGEISKYKGCTR